VRLAFAILLWLLLLLLVVVVGLASFHNPALAPRTMSLAKVARFVISSAVGSIVPGGNSFLCFFAVSSSFFWLLRRLDLFTLRSSLRVVFLFIFIFVNGVGVGVGAGAGVRVGAEAEAELDII